MKEMNIIKNEIDGTDCAALSTRIKVEYHETGWGGVGWDGMGWDGMTLYDRETSLGLSEGR